MPFLSSTAVRPALRWLGAAVAYYALARFSRNAELITAGAPLVLLAQGVAFVLVPLGGPWLATAVAVGAAGEAFDAGLPVGAALLLAASAAAVGLTAYLVMHVAGVRLTREHLGDTLIRTGAATAAALLAALLGLAADRATGPVGDPAQAWAVLVLANFAGIVIVGPFVRAWIQRLSPGQARLPEWLALIAVAVGVSTMVAAGALGLHGPSAYLIFPVVIWAALRTGRMGASAVALIAAVATMEGAVHGRGPFVGASALETAVSLDVFLVVLGLTGILLGGLEQAWRQAETGHTEALERHRMLIEQLPLITYLRSLDPSLPPLFQSPQVEELLGYPLERWLAEPRFASTLVHPDDREINAELNARSLTEDVVRGEYRMIRADGATVWVLDNMSVVRNTAGEPVAQQGFVVDISERKALEEQLGQSQRLESLGLLAGGIAHDFNNLLTAISGYSGLALEHGGRDNELLRRDLREVRTATARAAGLTRQLLAFGRRQVFARTVVDLNDVVVEAESLLNRVIGEKVTVVTNLDPDVVRVHADEGQLGQVLVNLALNARDAMPDGGTLTIATSNQNGDAAITVSDTGHGMDAQTRARIFEPFFSTKGVGEGSGLGLAMVHGIVRQTGGEITVRSALGGGAEFRIVLPGTLDEPVEIVVPVESAPRGSETIMLVEDEDIVRRLIAEMLKGQGYTVVAAAGPTEALELTEPFDLLLTDVVMPAMGGPELADLMTARTPGVGVLFVSGYSAAAVADRNALGHDLLEKPFTIEELARKVRQALDARRPAVPLT
jgi:PAS domain S-box-containing protein